MKYLLITTTGNRNTGDELIRIGVQNLVKMIDPEAEFELLDKETDSWQPREFNKAILCGMPLFWNNEVSTSQSISWWGMMMKGWISERKKDFLILGVGNVIGEYIEDLFTYATAVQQAIDRAFAVTVRNFVGNHPDLIDSVCPSVFAVEEIKEPKYKLCNFMPDGAHDSHFNPKEARIWQNILPEINRYCLANDYYFIVHSHKDYRIEKPEELGWNEDRIIYFDTAEEYLNIYAQVKCYFGNRMHGSVITMALGRPSLAIGYESRGLMVRKVGGEVMLPSEVKISDIVKLENNSPPVIPEIIINEEIKLLTLLREFIEA